MGSTINRHPRVNILQPGPGVGGHCIAVDPWFIVNSAPDEAKLIHTARLVNDGKPTFVLDKVNQAIERIGKERSELSVTCLGLAFKPDIDDMRESPALAITHQVGLMGFGAHYLVEPNITELPDGFDPQSVELVDLKIALTDADVVVLLVDHTQFKSMDLGLLSGKQVVDTRGIW
jgi:UDP-N-acetyl-D-mannosaminuronic acid dehydrogenase